MATPTYSTYGTYLKTDDAGDLGIATITYRLLKKWKRLCLLFLFNFLVVLFSSLAAYASACSPMFEGVERVYILVEYFTPYIEEEEIPDPLRQENIENTILELYKRRFSSQECSKFLMEKPRQMAQPYECSHDQPVELVVRQTGFLAGRDAQLKNGGIATSEMLNDKGTLNVVYTVVIRGNGRNDDPPIETPIVTLTHFLYRPGQDFPILYRKPDSGAFLLDKSEKKLHEIVRGSVISRLK